MTPTEPRRVALVTSSYHPHFGGVEEHVRHVAGRLRDRGAVVEVWTVDRGEHLGVVEVDGVTVRHLPAPLPALRARSLTFLLRRLPAAWHGWRTAQRELAPQLLHVHCFGPNGVYALALARRTGLPLVTTSHGETFADAGGAFRRSRLLRVALRRACRRSAAVTAVSSVVVEDLVRGFGATAVRTVPNGVDLDLDEAGGPPTPEGTGPGPVVVGVGRLVRNKGFDLLIEAVARCASAPRLQLVGDGPERGGLEEQARRLGVGHRVRLLGHRPQEEARRLMARADVVVVPSRTEAFGLVVLEAWAAGTPLVATARGGPAEIVTDGVDGHLVDPEDVEALAARIDAVLTHPAEADRLARAGRRTVRSYTWDAVVDAYSTIYDDVVASASRPRRAPWGRFSGDTRG